MKVVILAGGYGTRISEYTENIPKPMINIGGLPILWHIMNYYASYGHRDFYIALGYRASVVKEYFLNYTKLNSDLEINLNTGNYVCIQNPVVDWKVTLIDTGLSTMTGGRIKRMQKFLQDEPFLLTYGDGLSDINLEELITYHESHGRLVTMSAVRPTARFGELIVDHAGNVTKFQEKPQLHSGWINGGYFVMNPRFLDYIAGDEVMLEREPLEAAVQDAQLRAYKHKGFWQCMDTKRDHKMLEELWSTGAPWKV